MSNVRLVEVYRAANAIEGHLLKSALEDAGIRSVLEGEMLQGGLGELPMGWATSPRILVAESDEAQAREILESLESNLEQDSEENGCRPDLEP